MTTHVDAIVERLEAVHHESGHSLGRVFRDWSRCMVAALSGQPAEERAYADVLNGYQQRTDTRATTAHRFAEALGELRLATAERDAPILGAVYERIGRQSERLGQHFTPWAVCQLQADILVDEETIAAATADDPVTVGDPACGSGRLLLAFADRVRAREASTPLLVSGTDTDRVCAEMAVINCALAGVPARIQHGDSLTQETWQTWYVHSDDRRRPVTVADPETDTAAGTGQAELSGTD